MHFGSSEVSIEQGDSLPLKFISIQDMPESTTNTGSLIMINGPSSAGKSTLAWAIQRQSNVPFLCFSFDMFLDHHGLPMEQIKSGRFSWQAMRPQVFSGVFNCLPALLNAGNNVLFDIIFETQVMVDELVALLTDYDVFLVGAHCSLEELERRELVRGNRRVGDAQQDLKTVHTFTGYDFEINSEHAPDENAAVLLSAWSHRQQPSALFESLTHTNLESG